jgi:PTH1 family peptidyl-tRNA hydrolase
MWLVVGLGNPGQEYESTRHNIGFMVVDALADRSSIKLKYKTDSYIYGRGFISGEETLLIKPLTFMNRSGRAVTAALARFDGIDNILVIHDDIDLEKGVVRIKETGSSGGHRGIASIIDSLGSQDFLRLKIGVGRSARVPAESYVLRPFPRKDEKLVRETIEKAADAVEVIFTQGVSSAQNEFHRE